jgi:hypothetical protein
MDRVLDEAPSLGHDGPGKFDGYSKLPNPWSVETPAKQESDCGLRSEIIPDRAGTRVASKALPFLLFWIMCGTGVTHRAFLLQASAETSSSKL